MRVIFLDIDGVMNSNVFYKERHKRRWRKPITWWYEIKRLVRKLFRIESKGVSLADYKPPKNRFTFNYQFESLLEETCPQKWQWLSEWCNETGTKICVSSVWKHHFGTEKYVSTPERWEDALVELGFKEGTFVGITGKRRTLRGQEISPQTSQINAIVKKIREMWINLNNWFDINFIDQSLLPKKITSYF